VGYTDAIITKTTLNLRELQGSPVQNVAPWTASFGSGYTFPLNSVWNGVIHADYSYTDKSYSASVSANPERLRPPYSLVNFNAGVEAEHIECGVFIDNLNNAHPNLGDNPPESGEDPGLVRLLTMPPRTYGVRAGYKF
jgi:outer membrane receptor protein involved in Fe transport